MLLAEDGAIREDEWHHLADDEAAPDSDPVTISYARWKKASETLRTRNGKLGLRLPNDAAPEEIAADIGRFALIVLNFPKFTDGRAYSQARLLRERYRFDGELRASGEILRDQLLFMRRSGFSSFVVGARAIKEEWAKAFGEFDVFYQKAADHNSVVMQERLNKAR